MPITVIGQVAAIPALAAENIFVMPESRARSQDIRPLKIAILNLMPTKVITELQLLRVLSNTPLQLEVTFLRTASHSATHASQDYLESLYRTFDEIKQDYYDGLIITGAPVESLPFEQVDYWQELTEILDWSARRVFSTFHICWGAQAALYYHYGIDKLPLSEKCFGIFDTKVLDPRDKLLTGFDEVFKMPHSRHTTTETQKIGENPGLRVLAESEQAGCAIAKSTDNKQIYVFGHAEYDGDTLHQEYLRDKASGQAVQLPRNYYPEDDPTKPPRLRWRSTATLLYTNWLNYYVYQETPYRLESLKTP